MQESVILTGVLRSDIKLLKQDGQSLLFDPGADSYFKISEKTLKVISFMTQKYPLPEFQKKLSDNGVLVTVEELLTVIEFLQQNNLLIPEYGEITAKQKQMEQQKERTRLLRFSSAYLFFRLPPWHPEKFFNKISPFVSMFSSRKLLIPLFLIALAGYLLVLRDAGIVKDTFINTLSWVGLIKYFSVVVLLKVLHEAAHSIAAMHFHCRVRGIGVGFMLFYPRLYTDTTDSWYLPRRQRLLIDAAGIIAELLIGGIAALLWCYLPPGNIKSMMFYIFTVSTLSSLLVNGNPLIRYDGYYIVCDLLNIDNLMQRATGYLKRWWRYHLLHLGTPPQENRGKLLFIFGISSFCYRIFLYTSIILVIYHRFTKILAVVMLILEFYAILIYPCWVEFKTIRNLQTKQKSKAVFLFIAVLLSCIGIILFFPLSWGITLPGEVVPEFRVPVTIQNGGFLQEKWDSFPHKVRKGEVLFQLKNPQLESAIEKIKAVVEYDKILLQLQQLDEQEFNNVKITEKRIKSDWVALEELKRKQNNLSVRADGNGIFVKFLPDLSSGIYLPDNINVGEIISEKEFIYAYACDQEIAQIYPGMQARITTGDSMASYKAKVIAVDTVPWKMSASPVLQAYGGTIPVYSTGTVPVPTQTLYRVILKTDFSCTLWIGRTVEVKLEHKERAGKYLIRFFLFFFRKEF